MISLISALSKIQILKNISNSSSQLNGQSKILMGHQEADDRLDEKILRETHQDNPGGLQLTDNVSNMNKDSWRYNAIADASKQIFRNNGLFETTFDDLREELEEAAKDKNDKVDEPEEQKFEKEDKVRKAENNEAMQDSKSNGTNDTLHIDIIA